MPVSFLIDRDFPDSARLQEYGATVAAPGTRRALRGRRRGSGGIELYAQQFGAARSSARTGQPVIGTNDAMGRGPRRPARDLQPVAARRRKDCDDRRADHSRDVQRSAVGRNDRRRRAECFFPRFELVEVLDGYRRRFGDAIAVFFFACGRD